MAGLRLIVGLGNPGAEHARTRHNAGFLLAEALARKWHAGWRRESRFHAELARAEIDGRTVWLLRPQTFMNASGESVAPVARYYRVPPDRTLVVVDDADLPLGTVRLRKDGSSGGHHGLESVEAHLGTRAYPRLRLGIGRRDPAVREITGHVLGRFTADEADVFEQVLRHAVAQVTCWLEDGIEKAMARYNGTIRQAKQEEETQ